MRPILKLVSAIFLLALLSLPLRSQALSIDNVRFGMHEDRIRMVIELSGISDYRVFAMDGPYRVIVDLSSFEWRAGRVKRPAQSGIKDIREGPLQPGISRIVFDMDRPVDVLSAFLLPRQGATPDRLVVDFRHINASSFAATREKIHGTLQTKDVLTAKKQNQTQQNNNKLGGVFPPPLPDTKKNQNETGEQKVIVIDPGHGGVDPGAVGVGDVYEKHVVLALAKELKRQLEETGKYRIFMTREKDVFIKLADRVKFARDRNADLFVSIHADTIHKPDVSGTSVYTLSKEASDAQTAKLAETENKADLIAGVDLGVEDEQVVNILFDFARTETMNESKFFANTLVKAMKTQGVNLLENPNRHAGFAVLKAPDVPSILVEAGFMSNKKEAKLLNQPAHREKIAGALRKGINAFFEHVKNNELN